MNDRAENDRDRTDAHEGVWIAKGVRTQTMSAAQRLE